MKNTKKLLALALVIMSVFAISAPALADYYMYVNVPAGETVNVRDAEGGSVVFTLPRGTRVTAQGYASETWSKVLVTGKSGYYFIMSKFLSLTEPAPAWQERYGTATLKYAPNTYNSYVVNLQKDLRAAGYTSITNADGYFGTITETAVKNFQGNNSLTKDGLVGDKTKIALWNKLHP